MTVSSDLSPDHLSAALQWREAIKTFDSSRSIPPEIWQALESSLVLSPSSYGLQPWKFVVITRPGLKQELAPHSFGQKQVLDASHLVVFAARTSIDQRDIDAYVRRIEELRGSNDFLPKFRQRLIGDLVEGPRAAIAGEWAAQQVFIALGVFLASAAVLGIDTCPMGGFVAKEYDRILDLDRRGYRSMVLAAAGYRIGGESRHGEPKVRFSASQVIEHFA